MKGFKCKFCKGDTLQGKDIKILVPGISGTITVGFAANKKDAKKRLFLRKPFRLARKQSSQWKELCKCFT